MRRPTPEVTRLRARVHELEQAQLPLRSEVQGLTTERDRLAAKNARLVRERDTLRAAVRSHARLVHWLLASGKWPE